MRPLLLLFVMLCADAFPSETAAQLPGTAPSPAVDSGGTPGLLGVGAIEGDLYLVTNSGDVRKGAAGEVSLVPASSPLEATFLAVCAASDANFREVAAMDSIRVAAATDIDMRRRLLGESVQNLTAVAHSAAAAMYQRMAAHGRRAPTGMNAHYSFSEVEPDAYYLFSIMTLGGRPYTWVVPVDIAPGETVRQDLDNTNVDLIVLKCGEPFPLRRQ